MYWIRLIWNLWNVLIQEAGRGHDLEQLSLHSTGSWFWNQNRSYCNILLKCFDSLHSYFELLSTKCYTQSIAYWNIWFHMWAWHSIHWLTVEFHFQVLMKTSSLKQWQSKTEAASCKSLCQTKGIWPDTTNSLSLMAAAVPCYAVLLGKQPAEGTVALF